MLQGVVGATHHDPAGGLEWVSDELGRRRRGGKDVKNNFFRFVCVYVCVLCVGWLGIVLSDERPPLVAGVVAGDVMAARRAVVFVRHSPKSCAVLE